MDTEKTIETLKKIWIWLKAYWWLPIGIVVGIVTLIVLRKSSSVDWIWDWFDRSSEFYDKQRGIIETESEQKQYIRERYEETLGAIEESYSKNQRTLKAEEKEMIKEYVNMFHDDPETLAKEIESAFGIRYVPRSD